MEYEIAVYSSICSLEKFMVNGVQAEQCDFVDNYDHEGNAEDYGCGNMCADIITPEDDVLEKYKITKKEYHEIAEKVKEAVSFGSCGWCV